MYAADAADVVEMRLVSRHSGVISVTVSTIVLRAKPHLG
jgi:hypothetical protein